MARKQTDSRVDAPSEEAAVTEVKNIVRKTEKQGMKVPREGGHGKTAIIDAIGGARHGIQERYGATHRIQMPMSAGIQSPEATQTQRNTVYVPSAINRQRTNFNYGRQQF